MFKLFIVLAIVVAVLLILIVLIQNSKGGGLSSQFGGSGASQVIGVKKTTDLLEKVTWTMIVLLFVFSMASSLMIEGTGALPDNANIDRALQQQQLQQQALPPAITTPTDTTGGGLTTQPIDTTSQED